MKAVGNLGLMLTTGEHEYTRSEAQRVDIQKAQVDIQEGHRVC